MTSPDIQQFDKLKKILCKQRGIKLFVIPELFTLTKVKNLKDVIKKQILDFQLKLPENYDSLKIYISKAYKGKNEKILEKLKIKDCEIYSFSNNGYPIFICKRNHFFEINRNNRHIKHCPECYKTYGIERYNKLSIEDAKMIAIKNGGKCLSENYANSKIKLKWKCKENHEWESSLEIIKRGSWCPHCAMNKRIFI